MTPEALQIPESVLERWEVFRICERLHLDPLVVESTWSLSDVWDTARFLDVLDDISSLPPRPKK